MKSVLDVAKYFLSTQDIDAGDAISNLKLQKLVYYAQGFYVALHGKQLFDEEIKAWEHGPVVPVLYHEYKDFGANPLPMPNEFDPNIFSKEDQALLDEVNEVFGQYSAWKLRNMTHEEAPWIESYGSDDDTISIDSLLKYFSTLIVSD